MVMSRATAVVRIAVLALLLGAKPMDVFADADSSGTWRLLSAPGPPPPTFAIPLGAYDPVRHRLLVVENSIYDGTVPLLVQSLDLGAQPRWSALTTSGTPPDTRFLASLTYDPIRDRLLLFGGLRRNDVWALNLSGSLTWQPLVTTGTPPQSRAGHTAIYDPIRDRLIVFGGYTDTSSSGPTFLHGAWALSLQSDAWSALAPSGGPPHGREGHVAIYDPNGDRMVVFGGHDAGGYSLRNDLWSLNLGDSLSWTELHPLGPIPEARSAFGAILDPIRRQMWIEGGVHTDGGVQPDDVWTLSLTGTPTWGAVAMLDTLRGRSYPVVAYDSVNDDFVLYGGAAYGQSAELPLAGPYHWTEFLPPRPPVEPGPRSQNNVTYDSRRDRFVVLGGSYGSTDANMWSFVPGDTGAWASIAATQSPAYWSSAAVYDSVGDRILVTDGSTVWSFSAVSAPAWSAIATLGGLRVDGSAILDRRRNRLILYGGDDVEPHSSGGTRSEVWSLSLDGSSTWTLLGFGPTLYGSAGHAAFYDSRRDRMV